MRRARPPTTCCSARRDKRQAARKRQQTLSRTTGRSRSRSRRGSRRTRDGWSLMAAALVCIDKVHARTPMWSWIMPATERLPGFGALIIGRSYRRYTGKCSSRRLCVETGYSATRWLLCMVGSKQPSDVRSRCQSRPDRIPVPGPLIDPFLTDQRAGMRTLKPCRDPPVWKGLGGRDNARALCGKGRHLPLG